MSPRGFDDLGDLDDLDDALSSGLADLAPTVASPDDLLTAMRPRFVRARNRRRVVRLSGTLAALLLIGGVAVIAAPRSQRSRVSVAAPPSIAPTTVRPKTAKTKAPRTTTVPTTPTTASAPIGSPATQPWVGAPAVLPTSPATLPVTLPQAPAPSITPGPTSGGGGPGATLPMTTTTIPTTTVGVHVYRSPGGSVTVRFAHGFLSLRQVSPAAGYRWYVGYEDLYHVDVRFTRYWQVRYRLVLAVVDHGRAVRATVIPLNQGDGSGSHASSTGSAERARMSKIDP